MKIGIVSLGLIGGSLFRCLTQTEHEIYAVTRNLNTILKARELSNNVSEDINILKDCDVVFVASPINKTLDILNQLNSVVSENCIVLDCASVKQFVMEQDYNFIFIGSHPMAGTEKNGYDSSFGELFAGAKWVLTPGSKATEKHILIVEDILEETGADVIIADAKEHDEAVALISHMPLLISQALFKTAKENELAMHLASSGFRDMTRLCMSNLEMAKDMREYNGTNITNSIDKLFKILFDLNHTEDLQDFIDIKEARQKMYSSDGKNIL
jgi:arogenate dehydrogenase (NADP+)